MRYGARINRWMEVASSYASNAAATPLAFCIACAIVLGWAVTGPLFHYSDTWQLVINTGTTIVNFLLGFLILRAQKKGELAGQLKLNELVAASQKASNKLINVEDLTEDELRLLHARFAQIQASGPGSISVMEVK